MPRGSLQGCPPQQVCRVGLVESGEGHDTPANMCTIHRSQPPADQSEKRVARWTGKSPDTTVSGVSARMTRGCYEETVSVEFQLNAFHVDCDYIRMCMLANPQLSFSLHVLAYFYCRFAYLFILFYFIYLHRKHCKPLSSWLQQLWWTIHYLNDRGVTLMFTAPLTHWYWK